MQVIDEESDATISDLERLDNIKKMLCDVLKGSNVNFIYANTMRLVLYCRKFLTLSPSEILIPDKATSSESNGVDNSIDVGIEIGFRVTGKSKDIQNILAKDEVQFLDSNFISVEIKEAVWECGRDKDPGPDGKWIIWLRSCLDSAFASFLINSSPTKKFKLERGLRRGDPLYPFLFILALEALNVEILEATKNNIFKAINVEKDKIQVSHFQFTDDALILGEWSLLNAKNLSRILTCFHLASGLKVNFNKSKLFGIGVSNIELNVVVSSIGCLASEFPCFYMCLPIGAQMSRCANWNPIVAWEYYFLIFKAPEKVIHKLESIRRRFFWGGNSDQEKISWIAWKKVTLPHKSGGLGIGSLMDSNQSLLPKRWWRFRKEENALCCKVIRSIHGSSCGMLNTCELKKSSGTWSHIIKLKDDLNIIGINFMMLFKKKVGNRMTMSFWYNNWLGGPSLQQAILLLRTIWFIPQILLGQNPIRVLVRKLLNSVPKKFVETIEQYRDLDEMSFEEAIGRLTAYEERIKSQDKLEANDQDKLLMASSNNKTYGKWQEIRKFDPTDTTPIITGTVIHPNSSRDAVGLSFSWAWRRAVRPQDELLELTDLQNLIINLRLSMEQDTWEFTPEPSSLPTRLNLDHCGIDLDLVRCPICNDDIETKTQVLVYCSLAQPSAIEELDKSIYDCQVALGECITKVKVLRKQIEDTEDLKAGVVASSVETSTMDSTSGKEEVMSFNILVNHQAFVHFKEVLDKLGAYADTVDRVYVYFNWTFWLLLARALAIFMEGLNIGYGNGCVVFRYLSMVIRITEAMKPDFRMNIGKVTSQSLNLPMDAAKSPPFIVIDRETFQNM
nr:putative RNA-directed DNA polymerase, eukaryota, reverse transcriptase zinc-binding domain protein [Tanacetum cinerariifolium]